jgi:hypothetical protein
VCLGLGCEPNDLLIDCAYGLAALTVSGNQTLRESEDIAAVPFRVSTKAGSFGSSMMGYSSASAEQTLGAVALKPPAATVAVTGTATASITEADVVAGGKTVILTLTDDTWLAS